MPPGTTLAQVDEAIKNKAGQIVRDTVPNYDIAPEFNPRVSETSYRKLCNFSV